MRFPFHNFSLAGICFLTCTLVLAISQSANAETPSLFNRLDSNGDGVLTSEELSPEKQRLFERMLRTSDADSDGKLTRGEFQKAITPTTAHQTLETLQDSNIPGANALLLLLSQLDSNNDGRILKQEVPDELLPLFEQLVKVADANKDGIINRQEVNIAGPQIARMAGQIARRLDIDVESEIKKLRKSTPKLAFESRVLSDGPITPQRILEQKSYLPELFENLDANGDRFVVLGEIPKERQKLFGRLLTIADQNNDKKLSKQEFSRALKQWAERQVRNEQQKNKGKKSKNSKPKKKNTKKNAPNKQQILKRLLRLDTNADGKINKKESQGQLKKNFDRIDQNNNGQLDRAELARLADRIVERQAKP